MLIPLSVAQEFHVLGSSRPAAEGHTSFEVNEPPLLKSIYGLIPRSLTFITADLHLSPLKHECRTRNTMM